MLWCLHIRPQFYFSETPEVVASETFNGTVMLSDNVSCAMSGLDAVDPEESCITVTTCNKTVAVSCGKSDLCENQI